jgi:acetyl esterase/lipase
LLPACLAGCHSPYFWVLNRHSPPARAIETREFDPEHGLSLDVHRPAHARGAPVVVFFHGGAWQRGTRHDYRFVGAALAEHGVLAIVPDYRKVPAHDFPAFMADAAAAVAWARAHATGFGGDPRNVTVAGHSSGAHMAVLLATDARHLARVGLAPRDLHGAIGMSGLYDFASHHDPGLRRLFAATQWSDAQPVNFIDGDEPPILLVHGNQDRHVALANSERLAALLRARGEPVQLRVVPGRGHVATVNSFAYPELAPALADTLRFVGAPEPAPGSAGAATAE